MAKCCKTCLNLFMTPSKYCRVDCSMRLFKERYKNTVVDTHLLAWEQQELDCNQMVGYLMTKQLGASAEINSVTRQSKHRYHDAWPND